MASDLPEISALNYAVQIYAVVLLRSLLRPVQVVNSRSLHGGMYSVTKPTDPVCFHAGQGCGWNDGTCVID